jgi:hypothetical protein
VLLQKYFARCTQTFCANQLFAVQEYMKEHGKLPTVQECLDARDPSKPLTVESLRIYKWLWFDCLPATAHRKYWGKKNFYETCPSGCMPGSKKHRANVSIASEAYLYLQLENNHTRWTNYHQEVEVEGTKVTAAMMRKEERFKPIYSLAFCGQEKFKGFSDVGLERFEALKKIVRLNRSNDLLEVPVTRPDGSVYNRIVFGKEQKVLAKIRQVDIADKTSKRKRKAEVPVVVKKRICRRDDEDFSPSDIIKNRSNNQDDETTEDEN